MDAIWKRTYDALSQLQREVREGQPEAGAHNMSQRRRDTICDAIQAVRDDASSTVRLGRILLGEGE